MEVQLFQQKPRCNNRMPTRHKTSTQHSQRIPKELPCSQTPMSALHQSPNSDSCISQNAPSCPAETASPVNRHPVLRYFSVAVRNNVRTVLLNRASVRSGLRMQLAAVSGSLRIAGLGLITMLPGTLFGRSHDKWDFMYGKQSLPSSRLGYKWHRIPVGALRSHTRSFLLVSNIDDVFFCLYG